ncbi:MAG: M48 family metalloprotease [Proteobacteria bacterium]|jgi:heat shock protein HtpX|nr:M48 family metalloprotease [Pseudomonadota bacterium]
MNIPAPMTNFWLQIVQGLRSAVMLGLVLLAMGLAGGLLFYLVGVPAPTLFQLVTGLVLLAGGGALLLLLGAPWALRYLLGARTIVRPTDSIDLQLLMGLRVLARQAGMGTPRLGIIERPVTNAYTVGLSRNTATIVLGRGLLQALKPDELQAVLAHEIAHIMQGDMHGLTLVQGAVNMVTLFPAQLFSLVGDRWLCRNRDPGWCFYTVLVLTQTGWGWLGSLVAGWFSRGQEFRADQLAAQLVGHEKMIAALSCLQTDARPIHLPSTLMAWSLAERIGKGIDDIRTTHPSMSVRLAALRTAT